jgi:hypothetical protein
MSLNGFNFGSYEFIVTSTLYKPQIKLYQFSQRWLIIQKIVIYHEI